MFSLFRQTKLLKTTLIKIINTIVQRKDMYNEHRSLVSHLSFLRSNYKRLFKKKFSYFVRTSYFLDQVIITEYFLSHFHPTKRLNLRLGLHTFRNQARNNFLLYQVWKKYLASQFAQNRRTRIFCTYRCIYSPFNKNIAKFLASDDICIIHNNFICIPNYDTKFVTRGGERFSVNKMHV